MFFIANFNIQSPISIFINVLQCYLSNLEMMIITVHNHCMVALQLPEHWNDLTAAKVRFRLGVTVTLPSQ